MWSEGGEEIGGHGRKATMFQMWGRRTQEVGVSKREQEKKRRGDIPMRSMGEDKAALWGKGTVSKRSSHKHGRMDNAVGNSYSGRV